MKGHRSQVGCPEYVEINYENILPLSCYQDYRKCRIESALLLLSADYTILVRCSAAWSIICKEIHCESNNGKLGHKAVYSCV